MNNVIKFFSENKLLSAVIFGSSLIGVVLYFYISLSITSISPSISQSQGCGLSAGRDASHVTINCGPPENKDPRHKLSDMGIMWSEDGFINSILQRDSKALSLFLDGGWQSDKIRFEVFAKRYFDPEAADHWRHVNIDGDEACAKPEIIGEGAKGFLVTHRPGDGISADFWYFHAPDFYEDIMKYHDERRNIFIRRMCNIPQVISKIEQIDELKLLKPNLTPTERRDAGRWREILNF